MRRDSDIQAWGKLVGQYGWKGDGGVRDFVELSSAAPMNAVIEVLPIYSLAAESPAMVQSRQYRYAQDPETKRWGWIREYEGWSYRLEAVYWMVGPKWLSDRCKLWRPANLPGWYKFPSD